MGSASAWTPVEDTSAWKPVEETAPSHTNQVLQGAGDVISGLWKTATGADEQKAVDDAIKSGDYGHAAIKVLEASMPGYRMFVKPAIDQAITAYHMAKAGRISEAFGHGLAAITPGGPLVAGITDTAVGEPEMPPGQQVREPTPPQPYRALGQAATTAAIGAIPKAVSAASDLLSKTGAPEALQTSAERQYARVLDPKKIGNKLRTAEIVPELIERGITAGSLKSLGSQAVSGISEAVQNLNDAYENLPEGSSIPLKEVQSRILNAANEKFTVPAEGAKTPTGMNIGNVSPSAVADVGLKHAQDISDRLIGVASRDPQSGELVIPVAIARQLRQFYDEVAAQAGRYDGKALAEHSTAAAHGIAADAVRSQLNKIATGDSTIGDLNKEYGFWKDLDRVVQDTLTRREGQAKPLGQKIAAGAGTVFGGAMGGIKGAVLGRETMGLIEKATTSPWWGTTSAVMKSRLADAIAKGDSPEISLVAGEIAAGSASEAGVGKTVTLKDGTTGIIKSIAPDGSMEIK